MDDTDVARLMRAEVEAAETPSVVVNIERAMTVGRRQRWYARGAGAALAVVAVAVGVVTVPGLVAPDGSSPPSLEMVGALAPLEPYTGEVPAPDTSRIPAALETIDPTVQYVRFGWLPSGLDSLQYQSGLLLSGPGVVLIAHAADSPNPNWAGVAVSLHPRGVTPPAPQVMGIDQRAPTLSTAPAPDVRGTSATFTQYDVDGTDRLSLRWRYAPDGWAAVDVSPWAAGQDAREIALHVAQRLRFATTELVRMPAQVKGVVSQKVRPIQTTVSGPLTPDGWRWYAGVTYSAEPSTADPGRQRAKTVDVGFSPYAEMTDKIRAELKGKELFRPPNTTVDGHQASFYAAADPSSSETLEVLDVRGMVVEIDAHSGTLDEQGTKGLFQRLDLAEAKPDWRPSLMVD
ncbi:hypothetical protein AB0B94_03155 [Micromonospora sp. NPDC048986]|uniref:hypothetical protein n=1 Tax=Micromonospora sp. NPDC048986 TaxID=3155644 RepID=UPI0033C81C6D